MPKRIVGLGAARAVAIIAMMAAHLTLAGTQTLGIVGQLLYGFPSALFAVLAGMSMTLMQPDPLKFTVRGLVLIALHFVLQLFSGDIYVVLLNFGICMIVLGWVTAWPSRNLAVLLVALTAASALIHQFVVPPVDILGYPYPLAVWATLMVAGMLMRRHLHSVRHYVLGLVVGSALVAGNIVARYYFVPGEALQWLEPLGHTGGVLNIIGSIGMAAAVYSLCCLLNPRFLQPLGSMPLTIYSLHILTAQWMQWMGFTGGFLISVITALAFAFAWKHFFNRGPLEEAVKRITDLTPHTPLTTSHQPEQEKK